MTFHLAISLLTSAGTFVAMWAAGSLKPWAWLLGLGNQVIWLLFIVSFEAWGLLPLTVGLTGMFLRNHLRWQREMKLGL